MTKRRKENRRVVQGGGRVRVNTFRELRTERRFFCQGCAGGCPLLQQGMFVPVEAVLVRAL